MRLISSYFVAMVVVCGGFSRVGGIVNNYPSNTISTIAKYQQPVQTKSAVQYQSHLQYQSPAQYQPPALYQPPDVHYQFQLPNYVIGQQDFQYFPGYEYFPPSSTPDYSNYEKSNNTRSKVKVGFLENLNAKLAEQRLSGKAFAVRNLINSKALPRSDNKSHIPVPSEPDPRICHESLMDQIKRGATLKRNKSINDRSAPKIH